MCETSRYRIQVNKSLIDSFFAKPYSEATQKEIVEVNKVITIVLNHYYSKYYMMFRDLRSWVWSALCEKHKNYNPAFSSYNYVYKIARNEIGNKISKYFNSEKEMFTDQLPEVKGSTSAALEGVESILPYLSGDVRFTTVEVPKDAIQPLLALSVERLYNLRSKDQVNEEVIKLLIELNY